VVDVVKLIPYIMASGQSAVVKRKEAGLPPAFKTADVLLSNHILLGNTFFPFTVSANKTVAKTKALINATSKHPAVYPVGFRAVGPAMSTQHQPLSGELLSEMDGYAEKGERVIFVAFGTNAILSQGWVKKIWGALVRTIEQKLVAKVFWGAGQTEAFQGLQHPQIKVQKWLPQFSMLKHKSLALFVTHAGAESSHEGFFAGKPMLAIPIFGDQPGNARRIQELGTGLAHSKHNLTVDSLFQSINTILEDRTGSFGRNCNKISDIAHRASRKGLNDALDIIETVARHGDSFLTPDDRHAPSYITENYDIQAFVVITFFTLVYAITKVVSLIFQLVLCRGHNVNQTKKNQ
jgi:hypothetical protein